MNNVIVVGAGKIGQERIKALETLGENIVAVVDTDEKLLTKYRNYTTVYEIEKRILSGVDWIFVCTPHDDTGGIVKWALLNEYNVLSEKPLGRTYDEAKNILYFNKVDNFGRARSKINVGFNYRFYKGVNQLIRDTLTGLFGDVISVNMVLGLSNPAGTEKTWRLDPKRAGSGSIIYAGIHLIDLALILSQGNLKPKTSIKWSGFWNTGIEEEIHILATDGKAVYNIQSSVNRWRSTFRIEVNGTDGYGIVEGRNRYYGNQTYIRGKRWGWQSGKTQRESEELVVDYDGEDSFIEETRAVLYGSNVVTAGNMQDNLKCLEFIESL